MAEKAKQSSDKMQQGIGSGAGLSGGLNYLKAPALSTAKIVPNSPDRGQGKK